MPFPALSLKARALKYLSQREHSRTELKRKLQRYATEEDDLDALLNTLECNNWLSESRFSEALIRQRATRYGNARILAELQQHGIDATSHDLAATEDELPRALAVWRKKFDHLPTNLTERARQSRFLQQRGFSTATIRKVLSARIA